MHRGTKLRKDACPRRSRLKGLGAGLLAILCLWSAAGRVAAQTTPATPAPAIPTVISPETQRNIDDALRVAHDAMRQAWTEARIAGEGRALEFAKKMSALTETSRDFEALVSGLNTV